MPTAAEQFALENCRAVEVDAMERYVLYDLRATVPAILSMSNYYDVLAMIPRSLPYAEQKEYTQAVAARCTWLVRQSMARAPEFDLR